ncbi:unnamed protein product [Trichobilharzia regenti]|nr:unnamed protein product [Trichobilharzia regenti]
MSHFYSNSNINSTNNDSNNDNNPFYCNESIIINNIHVNEYCQDEPVITNPFMTTYFDNMWNFSNVYSDTTFTTNHTTATNSNNIKTNITTVTTATSPIYSTPYMESNSNSTMSLYHLNIENQLPEHHHQQQQQQQTTQSQRSDLGNLHDMKYASDISSTNSLLKADLYTTDPHYYYGSYSYPFICYSYEKENCRVQDISSAGNQFYSLLDNTTTNTTTASDIHEIDNNNNNSNYNNNNANEEGLITSNIKNSAALLAYLNLDKIKVNESLPDSLNSEL